MFLSLFYHLCDTGLYNGCACFLFYLFVFSFSPTYYNRQVFAEIKNFKEEIY